MGKYTATIVGVLNKLELRIIYINKKSKKIVVKKRQNSKITLTRYDISIICLGVLSIFILLILGLICVSM